MIPFGKGDYIPIPFGKGDYMPIPRGITPEQSFDEFFYIKRGSDQEALSPFVRKE